MAKKKKISGLGDAVAAVTKVFGIQPCESCLERQKKWNTLYPYKLKSREVTEQEWQDWLSFKDTYKNVLPYEQVLYVCNFYASVFNKPIYIPCIGCSLKPIIEMINQLNKLYETI